jgi:hypothetical protein
MWKIREDPTPDKYYEDTILPVIDEKFYPE